VISQSQNFLYKYTENQGQKSEKCERMYVLVNYTLQHMHILFKKSKIYNKTFKMLLRVSIILRERILFLAIVII